VQRGQLCGPLIGQLFLWQRRQQSGAARGRVCVCVCVSVREYGNAEISAVCLPGERLCGSSFPAQVAESGCGIASASASGAGGRGHRSGRGWLLLVGHLLLAIDEGDGLLLDGSCCRLTWG